MRVTKFKIIMKGGGGGDVGEKESGASKSDLVEGEEDPEARVFRFHVNAVVMHVRPGAVQQ